MKYIKLFEEKTKKDLKVGYLYYYHHPVYLDSAIITSVCYFGNVGGEYP